MMNITVKSVIRLFQRGFVNFICFLYSKRDGVQDGMEKLLNCWIYEMIAFVALFGGFLGIGFGSASGWEAAGLLWVGPLLFSFILNIFLCVNYLALVKRSTIEEKEIYFPQAISNLLKINALVGFFLPYGIYAKGMLFKHFWGLYKKDQLPWASPKDSHRERRRKFKAQRLERKRILNKVLDTGIINVWRAGKAQDSNTAEAVEKNL